METKTCSFKNKPDNFEKRQFLPDFVKCVAIVTVVWGHAIQYWHGMGYDYWNDPFFIFIYGFHMPLFALISGYLFSFSIKKYPPYKIFVKKTIQLIVPCFLWGILMALLNIVINVLDGQKITAFLFVKEIVYQSLYDFWFFKAVLYRAFYP